MENFPALLGRMPPIRKVTEAATVTEVFKIAAGFFAAVLFIMPNRCFFSIGGRVSCYGNIKVKISFILLFSVNSAKKIHLCCLGMLSCFNVFC